MEEAKDDLQNRAAENENAERQETPKPAFIPDAATIRDQVIEGIKTVFDPEIPVNIYELGLIYEVNVDGTKVDILMTLTSPGCPAAGMLPGEVEEKARAVEGVTEARVEVTFDPPWDQGMMSEEARLELGFM
jgi:FeS assembly SUF system protein